jgi:hypothetical protein
MIICPLRQASIRLRLLVILEPTWRVTTCRWRPLDMILRRNRRAVSSFPRCRRKKPKWIVLLIALIVWPRMIRFLRNSPSLSLSCASRTSAHCSRRPQPLSNVMCDQPMVETTPILVSIICLLDSRLSRPPHPDSFPQPLRDFRNRTDTQCVCGQWGHSVENCQQLAMHFLLAKHLQKDANLTSSILVSERWRIANEQNSRSARSAVRAIRAMLPEEMDDRTDDELLEYYKVDDTLSDFV